MKRRGADRFKHHTQIGSTLIELLVSFGILAVMVLSVCSALAFLQSETAQINLRIAREHTVMSFLDQIRKNLSVYQANFNPCANYNSCGTQSQIVNCNQPLASPVPDPSGATSSNSIVYWGSNGLCSQISGTCPGMMQVNIQPFGGNFSGQRGFFVVNITVCHQQIANGTPVQYEYLVTSQ